MDEEEWPVDPDAVVVNDEPSDGVVTAAAAAALADVPAVTSTGTPPDAPPDAIDDSDATAIIAPEAPRAPDPDAAPFDDGTVIALGPAPAVDGPGAPNEPDEIDPACGGVPEPPLAAQPGAPLHEPSAPRLVSHRANRSAALLTTVVLLLSTIYGRELVGQRNAARADARTANDTIAALRDQLGELRADVADATKDADDPIQNVFVDRDADRRADALDDILGDRAQRLRSCVASQLDDVLDGDAPQIPANGPDAQVAATIDWVEMSRGLEFTSRPRVRFVTFDEYSRSHEVASEPVTLDDHLYRALGTIPDDATIAGVTHAALARAAVGSFNPARDEIVIAAESPGEPLQPLALVALAHEVEHALVDDHIGFDASALDAAASVTDDVALARTALIEGDATLTMTRFEVGALDPISLLAALDGGSFHDTERNFAAAPHLVRAALLFPYADGLAFACELERAGGNRAIDAAYGGPPATTAQVLWPDRYDRGEVPTDIRDLHDPGPRWTEVGRTTIGAATLRAMFEAPGDDRTRALGDPLARASAWAGSEVVQWARGDDRAIGMAFAEHPDADGPTLCTSLIDWYRAAFAGEKITQATDGMVASGSGRFSVIRCANNTVRIGMAPDPESAAAITR
jgi:hypothetical protein